MSAEQELIAAVQGGDAARVAAALAAAPNDRAWATGLNDAVHVACQGGRVDCLRLLLAAGADPNADSCRDWRQEWSLRLRPIHKAVSAGHLDCVAALLDAGADPCDTCAGGTPLHMSISNTEAVRLLLAAAPQAATMRNRQNLTPLDTAIEAANGDSVQLLLAEADLQPTNEITDRLIKTLVRLDRAGDQERLRRLAPAVPVFMARLGMPLDSGDELYTFQRYRSHMDSPALVRWLPAMLRHSDAAAARLMPFLQLPPPDRERLRTLALCLVRYQRSLSARLPAPIAGRLLALAAAQHAPRVEPRVEQRLTGARRVHFTCDVHKVAIWLAPLVPLVLIGMFIAAPAIIIWYAATK